MLQAYMDDSGSHQSSPVCVVAGYFGSIARWREFERRWNAVLKPEGIIEFHAKRFWARDESGNRVSEYKNWDDARATRFLNGLLSAIERTDIYPFACGVLGGEWGKQTLDNRRYLTGATPNYPTGAPSRAIFLPFQVCVFRVTSYCKPGLKVHFVFDHQRETIGWASICYAELRRKWGASRDSLSERMGELTFADSEEATPLQAADLLAYEARYYAQKADGDKNAPMSRCYKRALRNLRSKHDFWLFDEARFDSFERFRSSFRAPGP